MYSMCFDRGSVVSSESKLCSVCVLTEGASGQGKVRFLIYVYRQMVLCYWGV